MSVENKLKSLPKMLLSFVQLWKRRSYMFLQKFLSTFVVNELMEASHPGHFVEPQLQVYN